MDFDCELHEEIEILKEIYLEELHVVEDSCGRPERLAIQLHPATGECSDQKLVCLNLQITVPTEYPSAAPEVRISNPRGLSEDHVTRLLHSLRELVEERKGNAVLYDIIEHAKETLTVGNVPQGQCMVCLEELSVDNAFGVTRTTCYHYFHNHCLHRYIVHSRQELEQQVRDNDNNRVSLATPDEPASSLQIVCPVCREPLPEDQMIHLDSSTANTASSSVLEQPPEFHYVPSAETVQLQQKMLALFQRQLEKGGIIDAEAERNKYLVPKEGLLISLENTNALSASSQNSSVPSGRGSAAVNGSSHNRGRKYDSGFRHRGYQHPRTRTSYNENRYAERRTPSSTTQPLINVKPETAPSAVTTVHDCALTIDETGEESDSRLRANRESKTMRQVATKKLEICPDKSSGKRNHPGKFPVREELSEKALSGEATSAGTAEVVEHTTGITEENSSSRHVSDVGGIFRGGPRYSGESRDNDARRKTKDGIDKREQQPRDNNRTRKSHYSDGRVDRYGYRREDIHSNSRRQRVNSDATKSDPKTCNVEKRAVSSCSSSVDGTSAAGAQSMKGVEIGENGSTRIVDDKGLMADTLIHQEGKTLTAEHRSSSSLAECKISSAPSCEGDKLKAESNNGTEVINQGQQRSNWRTDNRKGARSSRHSYSENRRTKNEKEDAEKNSGTGDGAKEILRETGQLRSEEVGEKCEEVGKNTLDCAHHNTSALDSANKIKRKAGRQESGKTQDKLHGLEMKEPRQETCPPRSVKIHDEHQGIENKRDGENNNLSTRDGAGEHRRESVSSETGRRPKSEKNHDIPGNVRRTNHGEVFSKSCEGSRGPKSYDGSRKHLGGTSSKKYTSQGLEHDFRRSWTPRVVPESDSAKGASLDELRLGASANADKSEGSVSNKDGAGQPRRAYQKQRWRKENPRRTGGVKSTSSPSVHSNVSEVLATPASNPSGAAGNPSGASPKAVPDAVRHEVDSASTKRHPPGFLVSRVPSFTPTAE